MQAFLFHGGIGWDGEVYFNILYMYIYIYIYIYISVYGESSYNCYLIMYSGKMVPVRQRNKATWQFV